MAREDYEKGVSVRRKVMGDKFVDKAMSKEKDFNVPVQDYINEHCWGAIWSRQTLPLKTRSIMNFPLPAQSKSCDS